MALAGRYNKALPLHGAGLHTNDTPRHPIALVEASMSHKILNPLPYLAVLDIPHMPKAGPNAVYGVTITSYSA